MDQQGDEADSSHASLRSSLAEQEEGLLGSNKEVYHNDGREKVPVASDWRTLATMGASIFIVLMLCTGIFMGLIGRASDNSNGTGVQTNDYILDPHWNFTAPPQRREYNWTIREQEHNPDGVYRPMLLVNNEFPGPSIEANEGDTIVVRVENEASNATSFHWHGIFQKGTPWMDGTVGITQCPIAPGTSFTYEFTVTGQSGTYWWHAHQGVQSLDGAHGPLIIHGRDEQTLQRLDYATDRVILVSDHYHESASGLLWNYLKPDMENNEPVPVGALINGRARRNCTDFPQRRCDNSNVKPLIFHLAPHQSHRIRIINTGAFAEFQVQLDEHELAVTEVDGTDVEPAYYHRIAVSPAQRYSVVVHADVPHSENFWFRARMIPFCFKERREDLVFDINAAVHYGKHGPTPVSVDWEDRLQSECKDMNTADLSPVENMTVSRTADNFFYIRANFEIGKYRLSRGFFNTTSFRPDVHSPSLFRSIDGMSVDNSSYSSTAAKDPVSDSAFINDAAFDISRELVLQTTDSQTTIDLLISNFDDGSHPIHLHGYKYFVLAQGHGQPPMKSPIDGISLDNFQPLYDSLDVANPLRRDTATVEGYGWILIRVYADNPGAWALHCHVAWHTEAGMLMQLLTATDELASMQIPDANRLLCNAPGIELGMGPDDEEYRAIAR